MFRCVSMCAYTVNVWVPNSANYKMIFGLASNVERLVFGTWSKPIVRGVQVMAQVNPLLTLISIS